MEKWHNIYGHKVLVEDGFVRRAIKDGKTAYPYRYNKQYHVWNRVGRLTVSAYRAGIARGTIILA